MIFRHRAFLSKVDHDALVRALAAAEAATSGRIRLFVTRKRVSDPVAAAEKRFHRLGMAAHPEQNEILLYVAPISRKFAVLGDTAIHEKVGDTAWEEISAALAVHFRAGQFTEGLLNAITRAGALLALHFPAAPDQKAAAPDEIEGD